MPTLLELPKADRKEKTRTIARMVYAAMESCEDDPVDSTVNARFYRGMAEWGMADDQEFYGEGFSPERQQLIDAFEVFYKEGVAYATMYDDCIAPVEQAAPHFAVQSSSLLRMWCIAHYWKVLSKDDGPFANLQVAAGTGMDEGAEDQEDSEGGSSEEEEEDDDDDDDDDDDTDSEDDSDSDSEAIVVDDDDDYDGNELDKAEEALEEKKAKKKARVE